MHEIFFGEMEATAHTAGVTIEILKTVFPSRFISRFGDALRAPRSLGLTTLFFLLRGYLNGKVHINIDPVIWTN